TGPRVFTLFFVPPRTKLRDHPPMTAKLCAGSAHIAIAEDCPDVGGAEAAYFGADQPRITAEMVIPWAALGLTTPVPGAALRAEIAITSWDGERWMSLSGPAPDAAMDHPESWRAMRLGNGRRMIESAPRLSVPAPG